MTQLFDRGDLGRRSNHRLHLRARADDAGHRRRAAGPLDPDERIWVTLERHMECGVGLCGHCQLGRFFVCRDGPVFSLAELGPAFGREGL